MVSEVTTSRSAVRPEIQALRAVAVGCVLAYHFWPAVAPAGFIGVDVFFVVSGFLITGLLVREAERSGRISLRSFYLRRVRRILPAAMLVLAVCALLTLLVAPLREWRQYFREIVASTLYYENWQLAYDSQVPKRSDLESTPVQHFWSLSVEEQFYLIWPLLILAGLWFAARRARGIRFTLAIVLGIVTAASLVHSILLTAQDHNLAYFSTFSRGWEFGVGGLLALAAPIVGDKLRRTRIAAGWLGVVAIALPVLLLRDHTIFPGLVVIVPVVGTLAVIWAGMPVGALAPSRIAGWRPVQWMGDISYSLYLWHWPVVMFTPFITGVPTEPWGMAILLVLSFALADATKRWVEDPIRFGVRGRRRIGSRPLVGGIAAAAALVAIVGVVAPALLPEKSVRSEHCAAGRF